jgi:arsenical pump membrane protein
LAASGLLVKAIVLIVASAAHIDLGLPTLMAGSITTLAVLMLTRQSPLETIRGISWSVLPLVAGLFVIVQALDRTGVNGHLAETLAANAGTC